MKRAPASPPTDPAEGESGPLVRRFAQRTPLPVGDVNVYFVPGQVPALVDTGPHEAGGLDAIAEAMATCGSRLGDLRFIVVTHGHVDHCGLAGQLQEVTGARVLAHPKAVAMLRDFVVAWERRLEYYDRAATAAGLPDPLRQALLTVLAERRSLAQSVSPDAIAPLADGSRLRLGDDLWSVHYTPGHSEDHICLHHRPSGILFCGDLLLRYLHTAPVLAPRIPPAPRSTALERLLASWRLVGRLPVRIAWPGHGPPIRAHALLVARRVLTVNSRVRAAEEAVNDGARTVWEIARAMGLPADPKLLDLTLSETAALLEWLSRRGRIERRLTGEVVQFTPQSRPPRR